MAYEEKQTDPVKIWFFIVLGIDVVAVGVLLSVLFGG